MPCGGNTLKVVWKKYIHCNVLLAILLTKPEKQRVTQACTIVDGLYHEVDLIAIRDGMRRSHKYEDYEKKLHC